MKYGSHMERGLCPVWFSYISNWVIIVWLLVHRQVFIYNDYNNIHASITNLPLVSKVPGLDHAELAHLLEAVGRDVDRHKDLRPARQLRSLGAGKILLKKRSCIRRPLAAKYQTKYQSNIVVIKYILIPLQEFQEYCYFKLTAKWTDEKLNV